MIDIKEKKDCCGCNACYDACPKDAISLQTDNEGFWYPVVDNAKCIDCGLCEKSCPIINIGSLKKNEFEKPVCFAAIHKNIEIRFGSTTGGLFSALAEEMYAQGGYVGGAVYNDDFSVSHFISNNPDDLVRLRQSKYSQSHTEGIFSEVKRLLQAGEKVLICGTPCQMAALRQFLRKDYDNLIIVDFICKSITSPKFYALYLDYWERKAGSKLVAFKFKDKELGWRQLVKRFDFKNGKTLYCRASDHDLYSSAYHGNIVSRPSCYYCQFKGFPRIADITIADFWGVERQESLRALDDDAGTSAVIVNNSKGLRYFETVKRRVSWLPAKIEDMMPGNPALTKTQAIPKVDRKAFFDDLDKMPVEEVVPKYLHYYGEHDISAKQRLKQRIRKIIRPLKEGWKWSQHNPCVMAQFLKLNLFCRNVKGNWKENGVIYPTPYSLVELQKGSLLELHGPLIVGNKKMRKSKVETRLLLESNARLSVETHFHIGYGGDVEVFKNAVMTVGHLGSNYGCTIICGKRIEFRGRVSLGREVSIRDTNAHIIAIDGYKVLRPVVVENHTWLCSGCTICPGVKIKEGSVVGANSYVVQNVPAHSLVSGSPAKVAIHNIAWKL